MTPHELHALIQTPRFQDQYYLIDVRDTYEWEFNQLPGAHRFPLATLTENSHKIPQGKHLIVYCHHGIRSLHACRLLKALSFDMVDNLEGGIHCWSLTIDPTLKKY